MSDIEHLDWPLQDPDDIRASRIMGIRAQMAAQESTIGDPEIIADIVELLDEHGEGSVVVAFVPDDPSKPPQGTVFVPNKHGGESPSDDVLGPLFENIQGTSDEDYRFLTQPVRLTRLDGSQVEISRTADGAVKIDMERGAISYYQPDEVILVGQGHWDGGVVTLAMRASMGAETVAGQIRPFNDFLQKARN